MDKEKIKIEYINEVEKIITSNVKIQKNGIERIKAFGDNLNQFESFSQEMISVLNKVLKKNNIVFKNEKEKKDLILYLKPTTLELLKQNILK